MIPVLILSATILAAAAGAVWLARPVHAALLLALTLALNAVLYLVLGAHFVGLVQFMVYVGAVAVLIVFSLMITRTTDEVAEVAGRRGRFLLGLICALPVMAVLSAMRMGAGPVSIGPSPSGPSLKETGQTLFTSHAPAVLAVAVLLTAVMIGAALLAREDKPEPGKPE
jgi:NADH-quinone oxidoreductase subunit J